MSRSPRVAATTLVALGLSLGAALAPAGASAQSVALAATTDVLTLRDGTILRGQIAELQPGRSVTLVLLTGASRTVAWELLAAPPVTVATAPAEPVSERDEYLTPRPGRVAVDIAAPGGHVVVGVQTGGGSFATSGFVHGHGYFSSGQSETHSVLCEAPCRLYVRPGYLPLWTGGDGNHATTNTLHVPDAGLRLDAHASSQAAWFGGIVVATLGVTAVVTGGVLFPSPPTDNDPSPCYAEPTCRAIAIGMMAGGAAVTVAGIWMTAANGGGVTPQRVPAWSAAVAPTHGGAMITGGVRF